MTRHSNSGRSERFERLVPLVAFLSTALMGCGGGGGGGDGATITMTTTTTTSTTTTTNTDCTELQNQNKCVKCQPGNKSNCLQCDVGYGKNSSGFCVAKCLSQPKPSLPGVGVHLGLAWPDECFDDEEIHFFAIGDWGGLAPGKPADNTHSKRPFVKGVDDDAQNLVAAVMNAHAAQSQPKFILSVGDNFYWGGVDGVCGQASKNPSTACNNPTFKSKWEDIYKGPGMDNVPWYSVLGNHDYGGHGCGTGWDTQIMRTYCPNSRWRMPAPYWSQKVQFRNFAVDIWFLDTNGFDAHQGGADPQHNICNPAGCSGCDVPNATWHSGDECAKVINGFMTEGKKWLKDGLNKSTADWRIAVTHFPPSYGAADWKDVVQQYPLDLIVTGHAHHQLLGKAGKDPFLGKDFAATYIITGGGGGITSEGAPVASGNDDQYGFVDFTISQNSMDIHMISHGGKEHKTIIRSTTTIKPRRHVSNTAAVKANMAAITTVGELVV